jgi:hypothetical protein
LIKINQRAGRVTQEVKYLPSVHEALSSNPSTTKKKKNQSEQHLIKSLNSASMYLYRPKDKPVTIEEQPAKSRGGTLQNKWSAFFNKQMKRGKKTWK